MDSHVGKHIFEKVIGNTGLLKTKTRVLVTHGITYLPKTDYIIVMKEGRVSEQGTYQELIETKGEFSRFMLEYMSESSNEGADELKEELSKTLGEEFVKRQLSTQQSVVSESSEKNVDNKKKDDILIS